MLDMLQTIDFNILNAVQGLRCGFLDFLMPKITVLGSAGAVWIVLTLFMLIRRDTRRLGWMLASVLIIGLIVGNGVLKNVIARQRPCWLDTSVSLLIENPTDYSFPSGHTLASFSCAFTLFLKNHKLKFWALALAALIAFSRLYLYVHFLSDVLGAIILSALIAFLVYKVDKIIEKSKHKANDIKQKV